MSFIVDSNTRFGFRPSWKLILAGLGIGLGTVIGILALKRRQQQPEKKFIEEAKPNLNNNNNKNVEDNSSSVVKQKDLIKELKLIHFNDVYNVESRTTEPVGGAARFVSLVKSINADKSHLVLFSGDVLNPSILSQTTKGSHMIPVLNNIGVHYSMVGNHDLDFGAQNLELLMTKCNFPWFLSNVFCKETGKPVSNAIVKKIFEFNGWKIGMFGIVELEWLQTANLSLDAITCYDPIKTSEYLCKSLRQDGAEIIICLTHMREHNDIKLAKNVSDIDIILGGHDHQYSIAKIPHKNGKEIIVLKSGTDFRELSTVKITKKNDEKFFKFEIEKHVCKSEIIPDEETVKLLEFYNNESASMGNKIIGETKFDLEARFEKIRTEETNFGNFVCDIIKSFLNVDVVLINSGTFRGDQIIPKGSISLSVLTKMFPMLDSTVVLEVNGKQLLDALENSVSQYPKLEGRFSQVSGIKFSFDPNKEPEHRVLFDSVLINGNHLQLDKIYRLGTKLYMAQGKDGYGCLTQAKVVLDREDAPILPTLVRNHFKLRKQVSKFRSPSFQQAELVRKMAKKWQGKEHFDSSSIAPLVEGRIVAVKS